MDGNSRTALSQATEKEKEATIKLLLENEAELDCKDHDGFTVFLQAAKHGWHSAVVKLLLENKADPDSKDKDGRTGLSWAVEKGHETIVSLLLDKGATLDCKDHRGRTALLWAAWSTCEISANYSSRSSRRDGNWDD